MVSQSHIMSDNVSTSILEVFIFYNYDVTLHGASTYLVITKYTDGFETNKIFCRYLNILNL